MLPNHWYNSKKVLKQYEADADKRESLVIEAVAATPERIRRYRRRNQEINDLAADTTWKYHKFLHFFHLEMLKHDITMKKAVEVITSTAKVK